MKHYIIVMAILFTLAFLASCTGSANEPKNQEVILRGKNLETNIISPILTTFKYNVYKIGDTVWVNIKSMKIIQYSRQVQYNKNEDFKQYIIEEDNDVLETQHYTNKKVKQ